MAPFPQVARAVSSRGALKNRLYCEQADSPRRRATQVVMARAFDAVCRLLAPILAYTADEAWEFAGHSTSVHTALFPKADPALRDKVVEAHFNQWLELRSVLAQAMQLARKDKLVAQPSHSMRKTRL